MCKVLPLGSGRTQHKKQVYGFVLGLDFNNFSSDKTQVGLDLSGHICYAIAFGKWFRVQYAIQYFLSCILKYHIAYICNFEEDNNMTFCPRFLLRILGKYLSLYDES